MSEPGPASDRLRRMASDYEEATSAARSEQIVAGAMARARAGQQPRRRPLMEAALGATVLLALAIGLGVVTAGTLPGDALYGVSRAYEQVGDLVGVVDPLERRLNEVIALADRGDRTRAALAASEALVELEKKTGYTVPAPVVAAPPTTTTTTTSATPDTSMATTPPTTPPPVTAETEAEPEAEDPVQTMKIAAETLLRSVQDNGTEVEDAAGQLAAAASTIAAETTVQEESTQEGASSTTVPGQSTSSSTTVPRSTTSSSSTTTTTTTVPGATTTTAPDGEGGASSGGDDGPGPIFLPPEY